MPPPHAVAGPHGRATVIADCGHPGLLRHEAVVGLTAGFLTAAGEPAHERTSRRAAQGDASRASERALPGDAF